ncbi:MAG: DUF2752 domain-containing protein [Lapillicoccus sp.]
MSALVATHPPAGGGVRGLVLPAAVVAAASAGAAYLYAVDPHEPGHYPPCPFLALTGYWCPGCGSARALHALLRGDLGTALVHNPATPLVLGYLLWTFVSWTRWRVTGRARQLAPAWRLHVAWVAIIAFWVLRNVPGWTWLSPQ